MYESREYQNRIINKTTAAFINEKLNSILIVSPTGSGKSYMALSIARQLEEQYPGTKIIWTAMRRKLLQQAAEENQNIGVKNIVFASIFDKNPPAGNLVIVDEAHHSAADTAISFRNATKAKWELGLTGTAFRTDKLKLSYSKVITDCGVRFLIEQNYLSRFDHYTIQEYSPKSVAKTYLDGEWGKTIFFMNDTEECYQLEAILKEAGVPCAVILGSMSATEQDQILTAAENGEIKALINIHLLTEGYDDPALETVFVRDTTKLPTMQMAGRVLRKDPKNRNKIAKIIQSEGTPYCYAKTAQPRKQYVHSSNGWLGLTPGPIIHTVVNNVMNKLLIPNAIRGW